MASLDESVSHLANQSARLNDLTNRLNGQLLATQRALRDAGVGVELWLEKAISCGDGEPFWLGWAKGSRGAWAFYVVDDRGVKWDPSDPMPYLRATDGVALLSATRATRVAAFPNVGKLVQKLTDAVDAELSAFKGLEGALPEDAAKHAEPRADEVDSGEIPF